jgi:AraC-like DNA-binding protein
VNDRVRFPTAIALMLKDAGVSPVNVLRRAGLPDDLLARPHDTVERRHYVALWRAMESEAGDPLFALHFGRSIRTETFDPLLFAALTSADLRQALDRMERYKTRLGMPYFAAARTADAGTEVGLAWPGGSRELPPSLCVAELVFLTSFARLATREQIVPRVVFVPAELRLGELTRFFGADLAIGEPKLVFDERAMVRPFLTAQSFAWAHFEPALRPPFDEARPSSASERVRAALLETLPGNRPSVDDVCKKLAVSKRTLQRRLRDESKTFQSVLDATRLELANFYLAKTELPQAEIAYLLGFAEPNSFARAYVAWTGTTPERRRRAG